jgi:hypothetical protein
MLIDDLMPTFEFGDVQKTDVKAASDAVFRAVKTFDMAESTTIRWLFKMRGIPTSNLTLKDFEKANLKVLAEKPNEEIVLGPPDKFRAFNDAGFIKACWNFAVTEIGNNKSRVTTEIRIIGTDAASVAKVKNVWGLVKPPTAMISKEILKLIKNQAEREAKGK